VAKASVRKRELRESHNCENSDAGALRMCAFGVFCGRAGTYVLSPVFRGHRTDSRDRPGAVEAMARIAPEVAPGIPHHITQRGIRRHGNGNEYGVPRNHLFLVMRKRLTILGSTMRPRTTAEKGLIARALRETVWPVLDAGRCGPVIHQVFPLAEAAAAHRLMESNAHIGKIMLKVAD